LGRADPSIGRRTRKRSATLGAAAGAGRALPRRFYERPAPRVARELLGAILVSRLGGRLTAGRIVETEAYLGPEDGASHAAFRPASRWLFYGPGGIAYVFWAYGLHHCLNAIAGSRGTPGCVLIRAIEPLAGLGTMARRRGVRRARRSVNVSTALASGPARLTQALGVTVRDTGRDLRRGVLTIHRPISPGGRRVVATGPRIGITRSPELPLRFWLRDHPSVSR